jgi:hypothetical protein
MKSYKVLFENRFITVSTEPDRMQKYTLFHRFHNKRALSDNFLVSDRDDQASLNIYGVDIEHIWNNSRDILNVEAAGGLGKTHFRALSFYCKKRKMGSSQGTYGRGTSHQNFVL